MEIASTASDGIQSRLDEHRQKELESQDRKRLSRQSNRQLRWRTIHRIVHPTRGLLQRPSITRVVIQSFVDGIGVGPESETWLLRAGLAPSCQPKPLDANPGTVFLRRGD